MLPRIYTIGWNSALQTTLFYSILRYCYLVKVQSFFSRIVLVYLNQRTTKMLIDQLEMAVDSSDNLFELQKAAHKS